MNFKNAMIYTEEFRFVPGAFSVENGKFSNVLGAPQADAVDLHGAYVIPGLIDVHNHGNSGADFSDGDYDGLVKMAKYLAANGVTSFAPASRTLPYEMCIRDRLLLDRLFLLLGRLVTGSGKIHHLAGMCRGGGILAGIGRLLLFNL